MWSLLHALIALDSQLCADGLQNLYQHDQQRRGKELQHHIKAVVTIVDGDLAKAAAAVTLDGLSQSYDGEPKWPEAVTTPTGLPVEFLFDGSPDAPLLAGT